MHRIFLSLVVFFAGTCVAQTDMLRAEIRAAYTVAPLQPGSDLLRARDLFEAVKSKPNRAAYAEALRAELEDRGNSSRMRVDGSVRLLNLSEAPSDSEQDETAQQTLLSLLWLAQTDFADSELEAFAKDTKRPACSRALAAGLLAQEPNVSVLDRAEVLAASEDELRERRRRRQAAGVYFKEIMPTMQRDTMKIFLKRRLAVTEGANWRQLRIVRLQRGIRYLEGSRWRSARPALE